MELPVTSHRFSLEDFHRMGEVGILTEDDRVELIDGEILVMSPIGPRHVACVRKLLRAFAPLLDRAIIGAQDPLGLDSWSEPLPDFQLLADRDDVYAKEPAGPGDVLLLAEVADSSLRYDRKVKLPKYAAAGIAEVWIVDLKAERIEVYRTPEGDRYTRMEVHGGDSEIPPAAFPDFPVRVDAILP